MRKNLLLGALTLFGISLSSSVNAQSHDFKCGNAEQLHKLYADHPELEADYYRLLEKNKKVSVNKKGEKTVEYTIPIVFHILHEYGTENISDAQVYDQMDILNEDYHNLAPDNNTAVAPFDTIIGNANLKFVLAAYDPYGNCTNGIEHIYTHMANKGDDYSKLNQWNRKEYLNIWVTNTIGSAGVAGYAYYPSATVGSFFFADGIIILNDYIGSIGTSNANSSRALTHEIGHWLGLAHTWGSTNDPGVGCGDDQVDDTPLTEGSDLVCNYNANSCNDSVVGNYWFPNDVIDNVQNYMDYSYCSMMFSRDQVTLMRNNLNEETAFRNNLWTDSNLMITGTDLVTPPVCVPIPDFTVNRKMACVGDNITFQNASYNGTVDTYSWSFPGATPATSSATNPVVTYGAPGFYEATLTVTNSAGSASKTISQVVYISAGWTEHTGPYAESFNSGSDFWIVQNPEDNYAYFRKNTIGGKDNSPCYVLVNYKDVSGAEPYSDDWFYYNRLGYNKDYLVTASYDLSNTSSVQVSFDYAYGTKATALADITEKLVVSSSTDCGKTWTPKKTINQEDIVTVGYVGDENFIPENNSEFKTATFNYTTSGADVHTRFRFEFTASDYSSNLYIDNFNVTGVLGIEENGVMSTISVSPNPVATGSDINVEVNGNSKGLVLEVVDLNGALISTTVVAESNGTQTVTIPMNVAKGFYLINAIQGVNKTTHRVVVY